MESTKETEARKDTELSPEKIRELVERSHLKSESSARPTKTRKPAVRRTGKKGDRTSTEHVAVARCGKKRSISASQEPEPPPRKKRTRCKSCGKKIGLTGIKCRCGHLFCPVHRHSEAHECDFDYQKIAREMRFHLRSRIILLFWCF